jgi:hypothetical protein
MRLWLIGNEDEKLQRGEPSKTSMAYQRQTSLPLEVTCVKFSGDFNDSKLRVASITRNLLLATKSF